MSYLLANLTDAFAEDVNLEKLPSTEIRIDNLLATQDEIYFTVNGSVWLLDYGTSQDRQKQAEKIYDGAANDIVLVNDTIYLTGADGVLLGIHDRSVRLAYSDSYYRLTSTGGSLAFESNIEVDRIDSAGEPYTVSVPTVYVNFSPLIPQEGRAYSLLPAAQGKLIYTERITEDVKEPETYIIYVDGVPSYEVKGDPFNAPTPLMVGFAGSNTFANLDQSLYVDGPGGLFQKLDLNSSSYGYTNDFVSQLVALNDDIYFLGDDGTSPNNGDVRGREIYRSNGNSINKLYDPLPEGTSEEFFDDYFYYPRIVGPFGDYLLWQNAGGPVNAYDPDAGLDIYSNEGRLTINDEINSLTSYVEFDGKLIYSSYEDDISGNNRNLELWVYDSTQLINPDSVPSGLKTVISDWTNVLWRIDRGFFDLEDFYVYEGSNLFTAEVRANDDPTSVNYLNIEVGGVDMAFDYVTYVASLSSGLSVDESIKSAAKGVVTSITAREGDNIIANSTDFSEIKYGDLLATIRNDTTDWDGMLGESFLRILLNGSNEEVKPSEEPDGGITPEGPETVELSPSRKSPVLGIKKQKTVTTFQLATPVKKGGLRIDFAVVGTPKRDMITGSDRSELLAGREGPDEMSGRGGPNAFLFEIPDQFGPKNTDLITDFSPGDGDTMWISRKAFSGLRKIKFATVSSKRNTKKASTSKNNFIYNEQSGLIYYNENGTGKGWGDGGEFVQLLGAPEISKMDFVIV